MSKPLFSSANLRACSEHERREGVLEVFRQASYSGAVFYELRNCLDDAAMQKANPFGTGVGLFDEGLKSNSFNHPVAKAIVSNRDDSPPLYAEELAVLSAYHFSYFDFIGLHEVEKGRLEDSRQIWLSFMRKLSPSSPAHFQVFCKGEVLKTPMIEMRPEIAVKLLDFSPALSPSLASIAMKHIWALDKGDEAQEMYDFLDRNGLEDAW